MTVQELSIQILKQAGANAASRGFRYLAEALELCYENPEHIEMVTKSLYPLLAKKNGVSVSGIENGIRRAIAATGSKLSNRRFIEGCVWFMKDLGNIENRRPAVLLLGDLLNACDNVDGNTRVIIYQTVADFDADTGNWSSCSASSLSGSQIAVASFRVGENCIKVSMV